MIERQQVRTYQQEQQAAIGSMTGTWNGPKKWENATDAEKIGAPAR